MPRPLHGSERRAALLVGDTVALTVAVVLALWTWSLTAGFPFDVQFLRARAIWFVSVPLWLGVLAPTRERGAALDVIEFARGIGRAAGALLLVYLTVYFFVTGARLPRLVALYVLWDGTLLVFAWRLVAQWLLTRAPFTRRVLVIGAGPALEVARDLVAGPGFRDAEIVDVVRLEDVGARSLDALVATLNVGELVVAMQGDVDDERVRQLLACQEQGIDVVRMTHLYEETHQRVPVAHLESSWLLTSFFDVARFRATSPLAKRAFDIGLGAMLGMVALLLAPVVGAAILIDSGRPVLYSQRRLGRGGRAFMLTKFRTMRSDAEKDGEARWSPINDPRVTRVGRFLRSTRLDELPNVIAVLRGDMSIVGPRPERPEFVARLEHEVPFYRARLIVRPGLTGWAQVNLPYGDSVGETTLKLEYDLYYMKHQSIWFDALIVLRTVGTLVRLAGR